MKSETKWTLESTKRESTEVRSRRRSSAHLQRDEEERTTATPQPVMADVKIFFCILLLTCYLTVTLQQVPIDCCLEISAKRFDKARVVDYSEQRAGRGCAIDATVMLTKVGRRLCMPAHGKWVRAVKSYVNQLRRECKDSFQETRCAGVKLG